MGKYARSNLVVYNLQNQKVKFPFKINNSLLNCRELHLQPDPLPNLGALASAEHIPYIWSSEGRDL